MRFRSLLLRLVFLAAFPLLLLAVAAAAWTAMQQRATVLNGLASTAQALQLAIDRELVASIEMLDAIAESPSTDAALAGDIARLHIFANRLVGRHESGLLNILLQSPEGQQLMNSVAPPGTPLPRINDARMPEGAARITDPSDLLAEIVSAAKPHVSDLVWGPYLRRYVLAVSIPVIREDRVTGVLTASIPPERLSAMLRGQNLPDGWIATLMDRNNLLISRNLDAERFLAMPVTGVEAMTPTAVPEVYRAVSLTGVPVYAAMARSSVAPWRLGVLAPRAAVEAPMRRALTLIGAGGLLIVGLGAWAAVRLGRSMGREVEMLAATAAASGAGTDADAPPIRIAEVEAVRTALDTAGSALRASEAQFRTLAETLPDLLFVSDTEGGLTYVNPAFADYAGLPVPALLGDGWLRLLHPDEREWAAALWHRSVRAHSAFMAEYRLARHDGAWRSFLFRAVPQRDEAGRVLRWVGTGADIQHTRDAKERLQILLREVDHRAKNALAVVQSVLRLTPADHPATYARAIEGRIAAMASAQSLLSASQWSGARLEDLIARELAAFRESVRIRQPVPALAIHPEATQAVAMVLHELATNAAKHGALSLPGGVVEIGWTVREAPPRLRLAWDERGGPAVAGAPTRSGFGTVLMRQIVEGQLQGGLSLRWRPEGLLCTIELPEDCFVPGGVVAPAATRAAEPEPGLPVEARGRQVLIVEDEAVTALGMAKVLRDAGFRLMGPVGRVDDALDLLRTARPDAAVLDQNLFGSSAQPVAEALAALQVPFVICTGYSDVTLGTIANDAPRLAKPVSGDRLVSAVARVIRAAD